jgi:hypothetical protein
VDELQTALPSPGFYSEISGFFEAVGIFLGFLFLNVNLGIFGGFFEKGKFSSNKDEVLQVFEARIDSWLC